MYKAYFLPGKFEKGAPHFLLSTLIVIRDTILI